MPMKTPTSHFDGLPEKICPMVVDYICEWGQSFQALSETSFWHGASSYQWMLACVWLVRRDFDAVGQSLRHLRRHLRHLGHCVPKQPSSRMGFLPVQIHTNLGSTYSMERLAEKCTIPMTLTMIFSNGWSSVTTWSTWTNRECMLKCSIRTPATWGLNGRPGAWYGWMLEGAWLREQSTSNSTHCSRRDMIKYTYSGIANLYLYISLCITILKQIEYGIHSLYHSAIYL